MKTNSIGYYVSITSVFVFIFIKRRNISQFLHSYTSNSRKCICNSNAILKNVNKWKYLREGNANIVYYYNCKDKDCVYQRKVLRVKKRAKHNKTSINKNDDTDTKLSSRLYHSISQKYLHIGEHVSIENEFLNSLHAYTSKLTHVERGRERLNTNIDR